jgi:hypothetical protein
VRKRHASPQAWRRFRDQVPVEERNDIANDIVTLLVENGLVVTETQKEDFKIVITQALSWEIWAERMQA